MDETEAEGEQLNQELSNVNFIFCNHPLHQREVDEDYKEE